MKYLKSKKGKISMKIVSAVAVGIIGIVIFFSLLSSLVPEAQTAGNSLNASNVCVSAGGYYNQTLADCVTSTKVHTPISAGDPIPLASLFGGAGVIFVIIMASVVLLVIRSTMKKYRGN